MALEVATELLEAGCVRRVMACDAAGCRGVLEGALAVLRSLAPSHPAIAAAVGAMQ